jgi:hypothetical protein
MSKVIIAHLTSADPGMGAVIDHDRLVELGNEESSSDSRRCAGSGDGPSR